MAVPPLGGHLIQYDCTQAHAHSNLKESEKDKAHTRNHFLSMGGLDLATAVSLYFGLSTSYNIRFVNLLRPSWVSGSAGPSASKISKQRFLPAPSFHVLSSLTTLSAAFTAPS